jgi:catechol 2,3-dioxygenase-like lactoylglutathione lyase family enzyme
VIDSLDHVQLTAPAGSEDALRTYYAGTLGMTEIPKPPALAARGGCWFEAGSVVLHLGVEEDFRPARKAHPGILVRGIDAFAARLTDAGADVIWDEDLPGHRRFYSHDPAGNRLEFLEPENQGATSNVRSPG